MKYGLMKSLSSIALLLGACALVGSGCRIIKKAETLPMSF